MYSVLCAEVRAQASVLVTDTDYSNSGTTRDDFAFDIGPNVEGVFTVNFEKVNRLDLRTLMLLDKASAPNFYARFAGLDVDVPFVQPFVCTLIPSSSKEQATAECVGNVLPFIHAGSSTC